MNFLIKTVLFGAALAGAYVFLPMGSANSSDSVTKSRIVGGQAKFVSSNPDAVVERGGKPASSPYAVNLMAKPATPEGVPNRLSLGNLRKRQEASQSGSVTQRNGSASLPAHNDVRRMDGQMMP